MEKEKSKAKLLEEKLCGKKKNIGLLLDEGEIKTADGFCEGYKEFLDLGKTEREASDYAVKLAEENGFIQFKKGMKPKAGDKLYLRNRGKAVILAVIGSEPAENGFNLTAAHIDSPRIDIKQNPLYEDHEIALLKTHYYGGIKKYQWTAVPLSLHGVIIKNDGRKIDVNIGEDSGDPVFCISDLLPHLSQEQYKRTLNEGVKGEELNVIVGSRPFRDDEISDKVKLGVMSCLHEKYGVVEEDFVSAELEAVPAFKARDIGFDKSMVGAYGQDDRVCAYATLRAIIDAKDSVKKTSLAVLTDKEETGSDGNTGLASSYLKYFICDLAEGLGADARTVFSNTECLSADVNAAFDPTFPDVLEKKNASYLNYGVAMTKYTGSRGKAGTSDASAEFVGKIRALFNKSGIAWQTGELGKVDLGGGGTVASYLANLDMNVLDVGVPVMSMHSPFELTAKADVYMAYKAFKAFFTDNS